MVVRENSEGVYASRSWTIRTAAARAAAHGRGARITCVDKANVLGTFALFREVADDVVARHGGVRFDAIHEDATAAALVEQPNVFDVLLTENLLGDILSDLVGAVAGGIGLGPSANLGDRGAMFEPHGPAPDLSGTGHANPLGQVLSAAMLLEWLGEAEAGALIEAGVDEALRSGHLHVEPDGTLREWLSVAARVLPDLVRSRPPLTSSSRSLLLPVSR